MSAKYIPLYLPAGPDTVNTTPEQIIAEYLFEFEPEKRYEYFQYLLYETITAERGGLIPFGEERAEIIYFCQCLCAVDQALSRLYTTR